MILLTPQELESLAERWQLIQELDKGTPQRDIAEKLGCEYQQDHPGVQDAAVRERRVWAFSAENKSEGRKVRKGRKGSKICFLPYSLQPTTYPLISPCFPPHAL
jgi:hypothetical protein